VSHIILAYENAERRCQDVLLPVPGWSVSLGAMWIGALILIALGILISSAKNGRMDLRICAARDMHTAILQEEGRSLPTPKESQGFLFGNLRTREISQYRKCVGTNGIGSDIFGASPVSTKHHGMLKLRFKKPPSFGRRQNDLHDTSDIPFERGD
jgi:hypothetical protein